MIISNEILILCSFVLLKNWNGSSVELQFAINFLYQCSDLSLLTYHSFLCIGTSYTMIQQGTTMPLMKKREVINQKKGK